jgi:hypothetical protein
VRRPRPKRRLVASPRAVARATCFAATARAPLDPANLRRLQNSFRANRFCVTVSASKACMVCTAPRCKRHRGREIVLDAEQASVWRNRRAGRISEVDDGLLRTALYDGGHIILTTQGLLTSEELGDADRQARRHEQGQGGVARRLAVSCIACLPKEPPSTLEQSDRRRATVRAGHDTSASAFVIRWPLWPSGPRRE